MIYAYRNSTNSIELPYYENILASDVEITINDGCYQYPLSYTNVEICTNAIKADVTLPNLDTKEYTLQLEDDGQLLKKYAVMVQEKVNTHTIGFMLTYLFYIQKTDLET